MIDNLSLVLQTLSLEILFRDYNNSDLMQELQTQDEIYLKRIIKQNEDIIYILKERNITMNYEEKVCHFKHYIKQTVDLMVDAYKWKMMAEECEDPEMKQKYMSVSNTLYDMFMNEHNNIGSMFRGEKKEM